MFCIAHVLDLWAAVIIHYSNAICTQHIYSTTAIKNGHIIVWKAIMTIEVAGVSEVGTDLVCLA